MVSNPLNVFVCRWYMYDTFTPCVSDIVSTRIEWRVGITSTRWGVSVSTPISYAKRPSESNGNIQLLLGDLLKFSVLLQDSILIFYISPIPSQHGSSTMLFPYVKQRPATSRDVFIENPALPLDSHLERCLGRVVPADARSMNRRLTVLKGSGSGLVEKSAPGWDGLSTIDAIFPWLYVYIYIRFPIFIQNATYINLIEVKTKASAANPDIWVQPTWDRL